MSVISLAALNAQLNLARDVPSVRAMILEYKFRPLAQKTLDILSAWELRRNDPDSRAKALTFSAKLLAQSAFAGVLNLGLIIQTLFEFVEPAGRSLERGVNELVHSLKAAGVAPGRSFVEEMRCQFVDQPDCLFASLVTYGETIIPPLTALLAAAESTLKNGHAMRTGEVAPGVVDVNEAIQQGELETIEAVLNAGNKALLCLVHHADNPLVLVHADENHWLDKLHRAVKAMGFKVTVKTGDSPKTQDYVNWPFESEVYIHH